MSKLSDAIDANRAGKKVTLGATRGSTDPQPGDGAPKSTLARAIDQARRGEAVKLTTGTGTPKTAKTRMGQSPASILQSKIEADKRKVASGWSVEEVNSAFDSGDTRKIVEAINRGHDRLTYGEEDLENTIRKYGGLKAVDGTVSFPGQEGTEAYAQQLLRLQQDMKAYNDSVERYNAYITPEAAQERINKMSAQLQELEGQLDAAKRTMNTDKAIYAAIQREGALPQQREKYQAQAEDSERAYKAMEEQIAKLHEGIQRETAERDWRGYEALRSAPDFEAKSAYVRKYDPSKENFNYMIGKYLDTGFEDTLYAIINGDDLAKSHAQNTDIRQYEDVSEDAVKLFNYIYATQGPEKAYAYMDLVAQKRFSGIESAALSAYQAMGLPSISAALGKGLAKLTGSEEADQRNKEWYTDLLKDTATAQGQHPTAATVGSVGGTMGLMASLATGIGAIPGFTTLPAIAQAAISGAGTMGGSAAIQGIGPAATGMQSWEDYAKSVTIRAAAGGAGGVASSGVGALGTHILKSMGLTQNMLARTVVAGAAGVGYTLGSQTVTQGAEYLQDPENYELNGGQLLKEALVGFAFSALGYLTKNYTSTPGAAAQADADDALMEKYFKGMTPEQAKKTYRSLAKEYADVINYTGEQSSMSPEMAARFQTMQEINAAWTRYNTVHGATAYKNAEAAKAAGDQAAYEQATADFKESVGALQEVVTSNTSPATQTVEAMEILDAVAAGMVGSEAVAGGAQAVTPLPETQPQTEPGGLSLPSLDPPAQEVVPQAVSLPTTREAPGAPLEAAGATLEAEGGQDILPTIQRVKTALDGLIDQGGGRAPAEQVIQLLHQLQPRPEVPGDPGNIAVAEAYSRLMQDGGGYDLDDDGNIIRSTQAETGSAAMGEPEGRPETRMTDTTPTMAEGEITYEQAAGERLPDGGQGGLPVQGAGEQAGGLEEGTGNAVRPLDQSRAAVERQNRAKDLRREKVSSAQLGVPQGTDTPSVTVLEEADWDDSLRSTAERVYQETGRRVTYVLGNIPVKGEGGEIVRVRGVYTSDGIIVQADNFKVSPEQIADHEIFHDKAFQTLGLIRDIETKIAERYTPEEFGRVVDTYMQKLRGVAYELSENPTPEELDEAYLAVLEEIFADAYAGINAFGAHAEQFNDTVEGAMVERGVGHRREVAEATDQTTGPPQEPGKYSYGGRNANRADSEALRRAEELEQSGADMAAIRKETGWFRGMDGLWRFEIDDSGMRYQRRGDLGFRQRVPEYDRYRALTEKAEAFMLGQSDEWLTSEEQSELTELQKAWSETFRKDGRVTEDALPTTKLSDYIQHEELFRNYPQLRSAGLRFDELPEGTRGQYDPDTNVITVSETLRHAPEDTLIHEIQHAIQKAEGFTPGASPEYWRRHYYEARDLALDKIRAQIKELEGQLPTRPELWSEESDKIVAQIEQLEDTSLAIQNGKMQPEDLYFNTAGEIEARDVADRRTLTQEERKLSPPALGDEDTVFAERDGVDYAAERESIKDQIRAHQEELAAMDPVASVTGTSYKGAAPGALRKSIIEKLRPTGFRVDRKGFGEIIFDEKRLNTSLDYLDNDADAIAYQAIPQVLKRGVMIRSKENHKGREYGTVTFAAPITINGKRGNMAVVVKRTSKNFYKMHRVLTPEGGLFVFPENENAELTPGGGVTETGSLATPISSASGDIVPREGGKIKSKFSMDEPVEETGDLLALHNLTEEKLKKSLALGGFPMPSIAVTRKDIPHTNFGPITLVFGKDTIDPQADRRNTVYSADAWTPTVPSLEYEPKEEAEEKLLRLHSKLAKEIGYEAARPLYKYAHTLEDTLNRMGGEEAILNTLKDSAEMMNLFLVDSGRGYVEPINKETVTRLDEAHIELYEFLIDRLGKDVIEEINSGSRPPSLVRKEWTAAHGDEAKAALEEFYRGLGFTDEELEGVFANTPVAREMVKVRNYINNGPETKKVEYDGEATERAIREATDPEEYAAWLQEYFTDLVADSGVYNNKEIFTPSGNRRSFKATHYPNTLEGLVKAMTSQNGGDTKNVSGFYGVKSLRAGAAERFPSIERMHELEGRLKNLTEEEAEAINDALGDRLAEILNKVVASKPGGASDFLAIDAAGEALMEIAEGGDYGVDRILETLNKEYQYNVGNDQAVAIRELLFDISQMPVNMYEAKPARAVGFEEILSAIVPSDTSGELRSALAEAGVPVLEYAAGDDNDRLEKVNTVKGAKFSVDDEEKAEALRREITRLTSQEAIEEAMTSGGIKEVERMDLEAKRLKDQLNRLGGAPAEAEAPKNPEKTKKPVTESKPIIAKQEMKQHMMALFATPEGMKAEMGAIIEGYADRILKNGALTEADRRAFFDRMYSAGVMEVAADSYFQEGRSAVKGGRIYVNDMVKGDFGEDWNAFRKRAFAAGVYLTSNQHDPGVDVWNMNLAAQLPGMFDPSELDMKTVLERIVQAAEEGKAEKMSLAEYTASLSKQEFIPMEELLDGIERQMDYELRAFAEKANLEIKLRDRTGVKIAQERERSAQAVRAERERSALLRAKEREQRREMSQHQREHKQLSELQQKTLKQLQWLSKNRNRAPEALKSAFDEVLGDLDLYAVGAANELNWSKKHGATWKDLAQMYQEAKKSDPNFLPSAELERIVARLDMDKIGELDVDALNDLYKAAVGLRTEFYNRNNVINDELHRLFEEVYDDVKAEIETAEGGYTGKKLDTFLNMEHLTPMNFLERMGGWRKDGTLYSMAKQLEAGERAVRDYAVRAQRFLEDFLTERADWVKTADGQGEDGVWYELEVPKLLELGMGDKPLFGPTVKIYMTPLQKVHLYLESKNYDNMRHIAYGGRTFVDKALYADGKRQEALAQGTTVKLAPETVKKMVSDLTEEERELAGLLERYYNQFSSQEINRVSNILYGFDKAISKSYAPIYTNQNFTKTEIGIFDTTAEGVGHMKGRQFATNPSYNISAFEAFERHVDQTSRFVGMAIPARNWQTLLNWRTDKTSTGDIITHKWGEEGKRYIEDLLTELQGGRKSEKDTTERLMDTVLSNYISSVFGFNPSIVFKQAMSFPLAGAYLGWENIPNIPAALQVDDALINAYTSELAYRLMGYATPETAQLKNNPSKLEQNKTLKFIFGGGAITAMDGWTVKCIWSWAENMVRREHPELELGTQEQINAGKSPFYQEVAKDFEEALSRSQPMYDVMHRAGIMRSSSKITRTLTLFKTVPIQQYNMLRQTVAEAQQAKKEYDAGRTSEEDFRKARGKAGRAVIGVILAGLGIEAINFLNAMIKNQGKRYKNDEGEITWQSAGGQFLQGFVQSNAGMIAGGDLVAEFVGSLVTGDKWYGIETPGVTQVTDLFEQAKDSFEAIQKLLADGFDILANGGDLGEYLRRHGNDYLGEAEKVAETAAAYIGGVPANNIRGYVLGALRWISPEFATAYEDFMATADKSGLSGLKDGALEMRVGDLLNNRLGKSDKATAAILAELYEAGHKEVIPTDTPSRFSANGEEVKLGAYQQQLYDRVWRDSIGDSLEELTGSREFAEADEETAAKMVKKLYDYGAEKAKAEVVDDYAPEKFVSAADAIRAAGGSLADWAAWAGMTAGMKDEDKYALLKEQHYNDRVKEAIVGSMLGTNMETESGKPSQYAKLQQVLGTGLDMDDYLELKLADGVDAYLKAAEGGMDPEVALKATKSVVAIKAEAQKDGDKLELYRAAIQGVASQAEQLAALSMVMSESEYAKVEAGAGLGITPEKYISVREAIAKIDDNGSVNQEEATQAIGSILGLTTTERATLWQLQNKGWKSKNNPFDPTTGEKVYQALHAGDDLPGLSLPQLPSLGTEDEAEALPPLQGLSLPSLDN